MVKLVAFYLILSLFISPAIASPGGSYSDASYSKTIRNWDRALKKNGLEGASWIWSGERDNAHKNKSRDNIFFVSNQASPDYVNLIIWLHGCNGFSSRTFSKRLGPQLAYLQNAGASYAIAIPEMPWSTNTKTRCGRQGRVFREPDSFYNYVEGIKARLDAWFLKNGKAKAKEIKLIIIGHSAGGSAIKAVSLEGSLCKLKPDAVIWSDASYGSWLKVSWNKCLKSLPKSAEIYVVTRTWDKPYLNARNLHIYLKKRKEADSIIFKYMKRNKFYHRDIGDKIFYITDVIPSGC